MYGVFGTATPNQICHEALLSGALWICDAICSDGTERESWSVEAGEPLCDIGAKRFVACVGAIPEGGCGDVGIGEDLLSGGAEEISR